MRNILSRLAVGALRGIIKEGEKVVREVETMLTNPPEVKVRWEDSNPNVGKWMVDSFGNTRRIADNGLMCDCEAIYGGANLLGWKDANCNVHRSP